MGEPNRSELLEQAFYYALQQIQAGSVPAVVQAELLGKGWTRKEVKQVLHRVHVQLHGAAVAAPIPLNASWARGPKDEPHTNRAFKKLVRDVTRGGLDLDQLNFVGPTMLVVGGLLLLAGLLGTLALILSHQYEAVRMMIFPVLIGVTFIKAGIDTFAVFGKDR